MGTQIDRVFLNHAPYFNLNQLAKKEFTDLVDMMEPRKKIIIEQVLCAVPPELNDRKELKPCPPF